MSHGPIKEVRSLSEEMAWRWEEGGVMCFTPTMEEFRDFSRFIEYMEEQGAHKCGVAKVKPWY